jgi:hypothetical protein
MRDCDIRAVLKPALEKRFAKTPSLVIEELGFNDHVARIDIAVVNCALHAYEIKSERDNLDRLPQQLLHYHDQFHFITVVAAHSHLADIFSLVDERVGIIQATSGRTKVQLKHVRPAKRISQSADRIARLFWWNEAIAVLEKHGLAGGAKRLKANELRQKLQLHFTTPQLLEELRVTLVARRAQQSAERQSSNDDSVRLDATLASFQEWMLTRTQSR